MTKGKRPGLEINFKVLRNSVSGEEGAYMIAAFLDRVKDGRVGGNSEISYNNVNFIFSGQLSINGSPIKGEIHFMQAEVTKQNQWYLGLNEGVFVEQDGDSGVHICTKDGKQYSVEQSSKDNDHEFRVYVVADEDKVKC